LETLAYPAGDPAVFLSPQYMLRLRSDSICLCIPDGLTYNTNEGDLVI